MLRLFFVKENDLKNGREGMCISYKFWTDPAPVDDPAL